MFLEDFFTLELYEYTDRLQAGADAQHAVRDDLRARFGNNLKKVRLARVGSKLFDIQAYINSVPIKIEVKSMTENKPTFAFFDTFAVKQYPNPFLDHLTQQITKGHYGKFSDAVINEPDSGFPGDPRVAASGRVPQKLKNVSDPAVLDFIRKELIHDLQDKQINYLALFNRTSNSIAYYHLWGENVLQAAPLPSFKRLAIDTYGGAMEDAMRVVVRIAL